jgi:hypothetical protein
MKFDETLMYRILSIPGTEWDKSCGYIFVLIIPAIFMLVIVGIITALIVDMINATKNVGSDA